MLLGITGTIRPRYEETNNEHTEKINSQFRLGCRYHSWLGY